MVKVNISGSISGGELWSTGVWCDAAGAENAESSDCALAATELLADVNTAWTQIRQFNTAAVALTSVSVYAYAPMALTSHSNGSANQAPVTGTSATGVAALNAICVSLLTTSSGASFRGRMYWPATGMTTDPATLNYTQGNVQTVASAVGIMLQNFSSRTTLGAITNFVPVVMSRRRGLSTAINFVRVDSLPDTQHRRENSLVALASGTHAA